MYHFTPGTNAINQRSNFCKSNTIRFLRISILISFSYSMILCTLEKAPDVNKHYISNHLVKLMFLVSFIELLSKDCTRGTISYTSLPENFPLMKNSGEDYVNHMILLS